MKKLMSLLVLCMLVGGCSQKNDTKIDNPPKEETTLTTNKKNETVDESQEETKLPENEKQETTSSTTKQEPTKTEIKKETANPKLSSSLKTLYKGQSSTLKVTEYKGKVVWSSSDNNIVKVKDGKVTAINNGTATISAKVDGKKLNCKITVKKNTLNKSSISITKGNSYTLKVTGSSTVEWSSSNTNIATVKAGKVYGVSAGTTNITAKVAGDVLVCKVTVNKPKEYKTYKVTIPTVNQKKAGYPRGCEGVSFYMALKGKGYLKDVSIKEFMDTMPISPDGNPNNGYAGDPTKDSSASVNKGKRTTIHPKPATKWVSQYGSAKNMEGASVSELKAELRKGNPIVVWMTSGFKDAKYKTYWWGTTVSNNHALCLVGYDEKTGEYIVNDCSSVNTGEYRVSKSVFEKSYNYRKYAVVIR